MRIAAFDQIRHRRRDSDGVAGGDFGELLDALARNERALAKLVNAAQRGRAGAHAQRVPQHLFDARGSGCQHHQAVEAERDAASLRHRRQRGKEIFVDRIALAIDALLLRHLAFEPAALLGGVGEFAKAVGEFHAAGIKLEALGDAPIRRRPRQRRQHGRVLVEDGRAADAEIAFDAFDKHAAEHIGPAVVVADADARRSRRAGESLAVRLAVRKARQEIDAGKACRKPQRP